MVSKSEMKRVATTNPMRMAEEYYKLQQENVRLREALEVFAEGKTWNLHPAAIDHARMALGEEK